jgi:hypothetical protein
MNTYIVPKEMSAVDYEELGLQIVTVVIGKLTASYNMDAKSGHGHLLCSRHALREMALTDMSFHQRAVIEFLVKEGNSAGVIYERLRGVYGDVCMGASSVRRWVKHFKDGNTDIADQPRCGRPRTAATERNKQKIDELIRQDRRITVREIAA